MRRLIVRRTHSVREQEQLLESMMMEMPHDDDAAGAAGVAGATNNLPSQQQQQQPTPATPPRRPLPTPTPSPASPAPSPAPPAPRARMPILCRALAIVAAAYGLYVLAALFGTALAGAIAASVTRPPLAAAAVSLWLASEFVFYLYFWRPRYRQLDAQRLGSPGVAPPSRAAAMAQFERLLALRGRLRTAAVARGAPPSSPRAAAAKKQSILEQERAEVEMYLSGWFRGCDASRVRRGNVADLISMGFWYQNSHAGQQPSTTATTRKDGDGGGDGGDGSDKDANNPPPTPAELDAMVSRLERAWGLSFPPGRDPSLRLMDHLNEPLRACFYPWVAYAAVEAVAALSRLALLAAGFRRHTFRHALAGSGATLALDCYMLRGALAPAGRSGDPIAAAVAAAAAGPPPAPLVFIHGVGGLFPFYTHLLVRIAAGASGVLSPNGAFLAVDLPHVSLKFTRAPSPVPTASDLAEALAALVAHVERQQRRHYERQLAVVFGGGAGGGGGAGAAAAADAGHAPDGAAAAVEAAPPSGPASTRPPATAAAAATAAMTGTGAVLIAHSYGTLIAARLVRAHRSSVAGLVLVDPVSIGMFLPQLLSAFFYRAALARPLCSALRRPVAAARRLGLRVISREVTLSATMSRSFFWSEMNIWPEDLPDGTVVVLGGRDELLDAQQVKCILESSPAVSVAGADPDAAAAAAAAFASAADAALFDPHHHHSHGPPPSLEAVVEEDGQQPQQSPHYATTCLSPPASPLPPGPLSFLWPAPPAAAAVLSPTPSSASAARPLAAPPPPPMPRIRIMFDSELFHGALLIDRNVRAVLLSELRAALLKAAARSLKRVGGALGGAGSALDRRAARAASRAGAAVRRTRTAVAALLAPTAPAAGVSPFAYGGGGLGAGGGAAAFRSPASFGGGAGGEAGAPSSRAVVPGRGFARSFTAGMAPAMMDEAGDGGGAGASSGSAEGGEDGEGGWTHVGALEQELREMMAARRAQRQRGQDEETEKGKAGGGGEDDDEEDAGKGC